MLDDIYVWWHPTADMSISTVHCLRHVDTFQMVRRACVCISSDIFNPLTSYKYRNDSQKTKYFHCADTYIWAVLSQRLLSSPVATLNALKTRRLLRASRKTLFIEWNKSTHKKSHQQFVLDLARPWLWSGKKMFRKSTEFPRNTWVTIILNNAATLGYGQFSLAFPSCFAIKHAAVVPRNWIPFIAQYFN